MGKIKKKKKEVIYYKTTDKERFSNKEEAQRHQDILDGKIKVCSVCGGNGRDPYYSPHINGSEEICFKCRGSGRA